MKSDRIYLFSIIFLIMGLAIPFKASSALTAEEVVQKAAAVVNGSKTINAGFSLTANGITTTGVIKSKGDKFSMLLPEVSTWYNGKEMYTYNPKTAETTVIIPSAQELLESNPLLYVKGGAGGYTYAFSTTKVPGKYEVELVPRSKKSNIKKLLFTINAKTFRTEKIVVEAGGGATTVNVTSFKTGETIPDSEFEYPKAKYPKAEIVDLR